MRCLSLCQPWATLIAIGSKRYETRSWGTAYQGLLAIHASKGFSPYHRRLVEEAGPFRSHLAKAGIHTFSQLPLGAVIAICRLVKCSHITQRPNLPDHELAFGDFTIGRWAWELGDVRALSHPISARGSLGLWEWIPPHGSLVNEEPG